MDSLPLLRNVMYILIVKDTTNKINIFEKCEMKCVIIFV